MTALQAITNTERYREVGGVEKRTGEGGIAFQVSPWVRLTRYLILGTEGGSYYANEYEHTKSNLDSIKSLIREDGKAVVAEVVRVSDQGLALKNDYAISVLALASVIGDLETRQAAFGVVNLVCRTGTHILHFANFRELFGGGWGSGMKRSVSRWFNAKSADTIAYQAVKYKQRDGWSLADLLRLAHPKADGSAAHAAVFDYIVDGGVGEYTPSVIQAAHRIASSDNVKEVVDAIILDGLPREAVPTQFLGDFRVWEALLHKMPLTAMIRNLGKMTTVGLIEPNSDAERLIVTRLLDDAYLKRSRIHPISLLIALKMYTKGGGHLGKLAWTPSAQIAKALDMAFYRAFSNVKSTGKRINMAVDVSGSMGTPALGLPYMQSREIAMAMALVTVATEPNVDLFAFCDKLRKLDIKPTESLSDILRRTHNMDFGYTLVSLPIKEALSSGREYDLFATYTDSETGEYSGRSIYYGRVGTAAETLVKYRAKTGIHSKLVVAATAANDVSVSDPNDPYQIDICGFSADAPQAISSFLDL